MGLRKKHELRLVIRISGELAWSSKLRIMMRSRVTRNSLIMFKRERGSRGVYRIIIIIIIIDKRIFFLNNWPWFEENLGGGCANAKFCC